MTDYVVEHNKRGVLTDMPHERDEKPHFSWSKPRSAGKRFPTRGAALNALAALPEGCYVLRTSDWAQVSP